MSQKDLQLKMDARRLFWRMGLTTRVNVGMRAYVSPGKTKSRKGVEEYTDLDVLGLGFAPDYRLQALVADCKTSAKRSTERMFWLRGVADFFTADNAFLVRSNDVPAATRQLSTRLGLTVVTPADMEALTNSYPALEGPPDEALGLLFDSGAVAGYQEHFENLARKLRPLYEYCRFDYWVYEPHRNVGQLVAHLADARTHLDGGLRLHLALFFECVWLATLSLAHAVQHVRRAHLVDIDTSLREFIFGGQMGLREKEQLAAVLRDLAGRDAERGTDGVLPGYYPALLEVVTRFTQRPATLLPALRYAEWLAEAMMAGNSEWLGAVFGSGYDRVAGKLMADVAGFLVTAADLDPHFRENARALLVEPSSSGPRTKTSGGRSGEEQAMEPAHKDATRASAAAAREGAADSSVPNDDGQGSLLADTSAHRR